MARVVCDLQEGQLEAVTMLNLLGRQTGQNHALVSVDIHMRY